MQEVISWVTENRMVAGTILIVLAILLPDVTKRLGVPNLFKSIFNWFKKKDLDFDLDDVFGSDLVSDKEKDDFEAIVHLRNRAIELDDRELLEDVKAIHTKFFNAHCDSAANNSF
jgi:hypothetical protein